VCFESSLGIRWLVCFYAQKSAWTTGSGSGRLVFDGAREGAGLKWERGEEALRSVGGWPM